VTSLTSSVLLNIFAISKKQDEFNGAFDIVADLDDNDICLETANIPL
jgi:hypothetical protein